ncbi:Tc toxin subunit A [Mycoavidus sp. SF9855]|uniref:Tc toxin subunit A n=1 Tax=Mycoavidus sp. SF9855 TaxID=2968475 RepID=UPI00211BF6D3|nr:Tc toxin subunit A [Mycoavidus sp. SF9855]UUM22269.1 Tc toxin subunit A [Mycoavidus sp. SF9855]
MHYDNAMCYAIQIARSFRERQLSSGSVPVSGQRTGTRSLVETGPTYANLFKENWDAFCKVGALEAIDSPVSYLTDIYRWTKKIEESGVGDKRIQLDIRRPDFAHLLIDHQSTHQPIPALQLANQIVADGIKAYLKTMENPDLSI